MFGIRIFTVSRQIALAEKTLPTSNRKGNDDAIAFREIFYVGTGLFDNTHKFVAEDEIFYLRKETVVDVQVWTTDRSRGYPQNDILRIFDFRVGNVVNLDVSRPMKNQSFHCSQRKAAALTPA